MSDKTFDTNPDMMEKAILISLVTAKDKRNGGDPEMSLQELAQLTETAGVEVLATITQNKESVDSKWFIGKGKVQEVKALADELGATTAIFDQELSGAQVRNLEESLDLKIVDRTQLILDIFAGRAKTREGIIQVELAQLSYLLPRLSGQSKNLSRLGGGIGTRGPGESKLETDRRHIRDRIFDLKTVLEEVVRHRKLHRERRKKAGVTQVALVGYTNAGKSTLLRELTNADVYVENQLFATLDPTSRTLELPNGREIILTDTVGFIQNLPTDLIAAFRATLEEVCEADLVLHVIDSSSSVREEQIAVVNKILGDLGASDKPYIMVYNKRDMCVNNGSLSDLPITGGDNLVISAYDIGDLELLKQSVQDKLSGDVVVFNVPAERGDLIALAYRSGEVIHQEVTEDSLKLTVQVSKQDYEQHGYRLKHYIE
ncbi:GTP-binding protein HflX [Paenibacillus endophyticus]|uniref:GTPase HflX n=1 Tax=Paenibacillus endophyticus TaxID=1294268 RepID=A0A7W5G9V6_9BACL|nr:GTPase HflX [Paenibacillus endophyticus]MBB3151673.1 GTP-binding protein HflX [Paenibacillus endophyticus]